jgi:hypothetical protein
MASIARHSLGSRLIPLLDLNFPRLGLTGRTFTRDQSGAVIDPEAEGTDPRPPSADLFVPLPPPADTRRAIAAASDAGALLGIGVLDSEGRHGFYGGML